MKRVAGMVFLTFTFVILETTAVLLSINFRVYKSISNGNIEKE